MSEEWTVVTRKDKRRVMRSGGRTRRSRNNAKPQVVMNATSLAGTESWTSDTKAAVMDAMRECRRDFSQTDVYQSLRKALMEQENHDDGTAQQIVCYGIGNLSTSPSASMWQLACALTLRDLLSENKETTLPLFFYDPCTTHVEMEVLSEWNVHVIQENERGKRCVRGQKTLFFMPHCPLRLYDNVLWANWNELEHVVILGNSLLAYVERTLGKPLPEALSLLQPYIREERIKVSKADVDKADGNLEGAFNDCYLTWFSVDAETLPPQPAENPDAADDDEVI